MRCRKGNIIGRNKEKENPEIGKINTII